VATLRTVSAAGPACSIWDAIAAQQFELDEEERQDPHFRFRSRSRFNGLFSDSANSLDLLSRTVSLMPLIHSALRNTGAAAIWALYSNTHEQGLEHVPLHGTPTIVVSNHHNQLVDVCAMTRRFPHHRVTRYWAKASLFRHPVSRFVLLNSGNVPVDRRASDNIKLFGSSLDALSQGEVLTLFPEGTSYTEPRILQVKDGASWLCCLFAKRRVEQPALKPLVLIPAGLVYTDKTRYRSAVIKRYV